MIELISTIKNVFPNAPIEELHKTCEAFRIVTAYQQAAFISQTGYESNCFKSVVENLNYSAKGLASTWPKRFRDSNGNPNSIAKSIERNPKLIANAVYNGRMGNRPDSDDGWIYRGRGYIQLTGHDNYLKIGKHLYLKGLVNDPNVFVTNPTLVEQPLYAAFTAGAFWDLNKLNSFVPDIEKITKRINGGLHGYEQRLKYYNQLLGC